MNGHSTEMEQELFHDMYSLLIGNHMYMYLLATVKAPKELSKLLPLESSESCVDIFWVCRGN